MPRLPHTPLLPVHKETGFLLSVLGFPLPKIQRTRQKQQWSLSQQPKRNKKNWLGTMAQTKRNSENRTHLKLRTVQFTHQTKEYWVLFSHFQALESYYQVQEDQRHFAGDEIILS
jgi:hypothetical protein